MDARLLYIIGYPGSGKTTAVRSMVGNVDYTVAPQPFKHTVYANGLIQLGYERDVYGGTDSLPFNVQPKVIKWLQGVSEPWVVGEGDRLANDKFFNAVLEMGRNLTIAHIKVNELTALKRMMQRGSAFDPVWVRRTMTKVNNIVSKWSSHIVTIDGTIPTEIIAEGLRGVIYAE